MWLLSAHMTPGDHIGVPCPFSKHACPPRLLSWGKGGEVLSPSPFSVMVSSPPKSGQSLALQTSSKHAANGTLIDLPFCPPPPNILHLLGSTVAFAAVMATGPCQWEQGGRQLSHDVTVPRRAAASLGARSQHPSVQSVAAFLDLSADVISPSNINPPPSPKKCRVHARAL